jgi:hypothetical protein
LPLDLDEHRAVLTGVVTVNDIEPLVAWLRTTGEPAVDLRDCNHLHTGVIQALLLFQPKVSAAPTDGFLAAWVLPLLAKSGGPHAEPGDGHDHSNDR